jgi:hypothetical protein
VNALTGIPVELLFTIIGTLIVGIYLDLKREVRSLRKESNVRGTSIALIRQAVNAICNHIKLPFHIEDKQDG